MGLTRKESFRQVNRQREEQVSDQDVFIRNELSSIEGIHVDDIDVITNGLRFLDIDQTCSNIKQEDLPRLFTEFTLPIAGHDLRQKITARGIKLESTTPISLKTIGELYLEVSQEKEAARPNFFKVLSKAKDLVKIAQRRPKSRMIVEEEEEEQPDVQCSQNLCVQTSAEEQSSRSISSSSAPNSNDLARETLKSEHTYSIAERRSFSEWINSQLKDDKLVASYLPISAESDADLFEKLSDGLVFCRMLHLVSPKLINQRAINTQMKTPFHKIENLNLVLNSAASIGCNTINQDVTGLFDEVPYLCLGLLWQIIRAGLFNEIQLKKEPEIFEALRSLLQEGESYAKLQSMKPEEILLRWVNHHLENNDRYDGEPITNFGNDIKDSVAYQHLLQQLLTHDGVLDTQLNCQSVGDHTTRAQHTLKLADKLGCKAFVSPADIVSGNVKLNTAFVANLFNKKMHLKPPEKSDDSEETGEEEEVYIETAEEKTYRNFINSLDIKPMIMYLYEDLRDGVALLKLEDRIQPGVVDWKKRVNFPPFKTPFQGGENCIYALDIATGKIKANLGHGQVRGHDINVGRPKVLTLGLVWQLMRAYTLSLLARLSDDGKTLDDKDVIAWVNKKAESLAGFTPIRSFKDPCLKNGDVIRHILLTIDPHMQIDSRSDDDLLENASYLISIARKMGAVVYTLPEDVVNSNPKMTLCLFVTLMILEHQKTKKISRVMSVRKPPLPPKPKSRSSVGSSVSSEKAIETQL